LEKCHIDLRRGESLNFEEKSGDQRKSSKTGRQLLQKTTFFQGKKQNGRKNCNHGKPDTGAERFFGKKSVTVGDHEKATLCRSPNPSPLSQAKPGTESWVFFIL